MRFILLQHLFYFSEHETTPDFVGCDVGVISTLSWSIGPIIGGPIVTRMRITVTKALGLTVGFHVVSFSGYLLALFINCSESPWAGSIDNDGLIIPQLLADLINILGVKIMALNKIKITNYNEINT